MNAKISDNAFVYSDGQNSGIVIDQIGKAGDTISFNVSFTDTTNVGIWQNLGSSILEKSNSSVLDMAVDESSNYPNVLLGAYNNEISNKIAVYGYLKSQWIAITSEITDYSYNCQLAYYGGDPYVLYADTNDVLKLVKYKDSQWNVI